MEQVVHPYTSDNSVVAVDSDEEHPWRRVQMANELAVRSSLDPEIRRLAGQVLKNCPNVYKYGAKAIAKWIRKNFIYLQESPGIEVLQGPYMSMYSGVVDCDDAAILFVALTRAAGLTTHFCGIGSDAQPYVMLHAVGFDAHTGQLYELIDDSAYLRPVRMMKNGMRFRLPLDHFALYYSNEPGSEGFYVLPSGSKTFTLVKDIPEDPDLNDGVSAMTCRGCVRPYGEMGKKGDVGSSYPGSTSPGGTTSPTAGETRSPADESAGINWTSIIETALSAGGEVAEAAIVGDDGEVVYVDGGTGPGAGAGYTKDDNKVWWIIGGVAVGGLLLYTLMSKDEG
jgi:hypothetical protein